MNLEDDKTEWQPGSGTNRAPYHDRRLSENPNRTLKPADPERNKAGGMLEMLKFGVIVGWIAGLVIGIIGWSAIGWTLWHCAAIGSIIGVVVSALSTLPRFRSK